MQHLHFYRVGARVNFGLLDQRLNQHSHTLSNIALNSPEIVLNMQFRVMESYELTV